MSAMMDVFLADLAAKGLQWNPVTGEAERGSGYVEYSGPRQRPQSEIANVTLQRVDQIRRGLDPAENPIDPTLIGNDRELFQRMAANGTLPQHAIPTAIEFGAISSAADVSPVVNTAQENAPPANALDSVDNVPPPVVTTPAPPPVTNTAGPEAPATVVDNTPSDTAGVQEAGGGQVIVVTPSGGGGGGGYTAPANNFGSAAPAPIVVQSGGSDSSAGGSDMLPLLLMIGSFFVL